MVAWFEPPCVADPICNARNHIGRLVRRVFARHDKLDVLVRAFVLPARCWIRVNTP
jgi:hypothetical protein